MISKHVLTISAISERETPTHTLIFRSAGQRGRVQELDENEIKLKPLIYCHFAEGIGEPKYAPVKNWAQLVKSLDDALHSYNELVNKHRRCCAERERKTSLITACYRCRR